MLRTSLATSPRPSAQADNDLENPTLDKLRRLMTLIFKSPQRYGLISRDEACNPMQFVRCKTTSGFEAQTITPAQAVSPSILRSEDR